MRRLLNEIYRPKTLEGYSFPDKDIETKVKKWIAKKNIPNVLLSGPPGCGKSTLANILINELDIEDMDVKYVAASLIKPMEFIREELEPWLQRSPMGEMKIVYFEEFDRLTVDAMKALRTITENYSDHCRFISSCNYPKKLLPELHSRFQHLEFKSMDMNNLLDFIVNMIEKEGIIINDEHDLMSHIEAYTPDLRKIINSIDEHVDEKSILRPLRGDSGAFDMEQWDNLWANEKSPLESFEELLGLCELVDQNNFEWFYEVMYNNSHKLPDQGLGVILISQYLDRAYRVANQRLTLEACLWDIFSSSKECLRG